MQRSQSCRAQFASGPSLFHFSIPATSAMSLLHFSTLLGRLSIFPFCLVRLHASLHLCKFNLLFTSLHQRRVIRCWMDFSPHLRPLTEYLNILKVLLRRYSFCVYLMVQYVTLTSRCSSAGSGAAFAGLLQFWHGQLRIHVWSHVCCLDHQRGRYEKLSYYLRLQAPLFVVLFCQLFFFCPKSV